MGLEVVGLLKIKGRLHMSTDGLANRRDLSQTNGAGQEHVRAKLTALLDDVTVQNSSPAVAVEEDTAALAPQAAEQAPVWGETAQARSPEVAQVTAQIKSIQAGAGKANPDAVAKSAPQKELTPGAVVIKGRSEGVVIEIGKGQWSDLLEELAERLTQAGGFFRGGNVALDVGSRPLLETELVAAQTLLETSGMKLAVVLSGAERTFEAAISLGLAARLLDAEGGTDAEVESSDSNQGFARYFVYRGNLRSGQILERNEHVMIVGDVNPGAEVSSQGDILIWGRMRGIAQAGSNGDKRAIVVALQMEPIQLRIGGILAIDTATTERANGRWTRKATEKRPEVAYVANERIMIEPWDESKPGGLTAFRR